MAHRHKRRRRQRDVASKFFYPSYSLIIRLVHREQLNGGEASRQRDVASKFFHLSFSLAIHPVGAEQLNGGEASSSRRVRLCRRERTWTYVTKTKRKPDAEMRCLYVVYKPDAEMRRLYVVLFRSERYNRILLRRRAGRDQTADKGHCDACHNHNYRGRKR